MNEHEPPAFPGPEMPPVLGEALRAARDERPGDAQIAKLAARLPRGSAGPPPGSGAPPASVLSSALLGAALGVVVVGAVFVWPGAREAAPAARPAAAPPREESVEPARVGSTVPLGAAPTGRPASGTRGPATGAPPPARGLPGAAPSASGPVDPAPPEAAAAASVAPAEAETEVHLLQRAQDALGASPAQALALAQEHAARFPGGALAQEREVVAIQALLRLGRAGEARARRDRFVDAYPGSAHRRRLEALLGP